jgi:hypothetical protein
MSSSSSLQQRRRPGPQPPGPTHEQLFREAFMHALTGCCSQFEVAPFMNRKPNFSEGDAELERARVLTRRSWNVATYACQLFEQSSRITKFNEEVG